MNFKKFFVGFVLIISIGFAAWKLTTAQPTPTYQQQYAVDVTIDDGQSVATVSGLTVSNAFEALRQFGEQKQIEIKTKQYDFGVFVEQVGQKMNTKDNAWIYFVNGMSGDVAADKKELHNGDMVEWRYTKPMY
jgi:Domain of unknown function (DUF4430)